MTVTGAVVPDSADCETVITEVVSAVDGDVNNEVDDDEKVNVGDELVV